MFDSVVMFEGTIYEKGFGWIPRQVMRDKSLKPTSKTIYAYICSFASNSNSGEVTAFPSVALQCAELGISENTYFTHRRPLVEKGYLQIRRKKGEAGKFDRNEYVISTKPEPLEPNEPKVLEESIPQNLGYGENLDVEPFEPHLKNCGTDEPYLKSSCMDNPSVENCGTKTTNTKTTSTKSNTLFSSSSSRESNLAIYELINKEMKKTYPDVPFDEIKDELLNDESATINTAKQYHAMLKYRLENYKPHKQSKRPQFKAKQPLHKEVLPNWFDEEEGYQKASENKPEMTQEEFAEKQAEIKRILEEFRNSTKD